MLRKVYDQYYNTYAQKKKNEIRHKNDLKNLFKRLNVGAFVVKVK